MGSLSNGYVNGHHESDGLLDGNGINGHVHGPSVPEPIAIVGMALRLPGKIHSPEALWQLLIDKRDTRGIIPLTRYNADGFYSASKRPGCTGVKYGHFLDESDGIDLLDTSFFTMSKAEVEKLDPQQRMLLEVVYECMENGGQRDWRSSNTGVFVGTWGDDWQDFLAKDPQQTGGMLNVSGAGDFAISNRVSYEYDLQGPSMTIKAACASSVICLHEACQAILNGDCDSAIVAGTNLILTPSQTISQTEAGVLSPTGQCRTFDASANGYARGEAINAIYIKKLSDAVRDHDPIRAVVRATAVNGDGRSAGLSQPNPDAHERLIRRAYARAGLMDFSETPFVEVHGTGTPSGDPLELQAISKVFGGLTDTYVGSVKANVGHGEGASGITSIIKAVMALENRTIPPQVNFSRPNPKIPFEEARLIVPLEATPWPANRPERISVNSFGITGANAHAIIESAGSYGIPPRHHSNGVLNGAPNGISHDTHRPSLLVFSATNTESLKRQSSNLLARAVDHPEEIVDLAHTLASRRDHLSHRAFSVTNGLTLEDFVSADKVKQVPRPFFVFTGQGAQWPGMGKELMEDFSSFRHDILHFSKLLTQLPHPPSWDLTDELLKTGPKSRLDKAEFAQPLCTALQVALVNLLRELGITPKAVVGHSSGEIAAAYAADAITAEEALIIAYYRGLTATSSPQRGAMAAVGIGRAEATLYLEKGVVIACDNSPNSVTLSGDEDALDRMTEQMKFDDESLFIRRLKTDGMAYHSYHMLEVGQNYEELLQPLLTARTPAVPFYSTVTGKLAEERIPGPAYWRENLESSVKFYPAVKTMIENQKSDLLFLEIGPHSAMAGPLRQIFKSTSSKSRLAYLPTLVRGRNAFECILELCGQLFLQTVPVRFEKLTPNGRILTDLPNYPWRHDVSHWTENRVVKEWRTRRFPPHELLGSRILEGNDFEPTWRNLLRLKDASWLQDHKVLDDVVFPCAGYVAMAGEAIKQLTGSDDYSIRDLNVKSAMVLQDKTVEVFTSFRSVEPTSAPTPEWYEFAIYSHNGSIWTKHCDGHARGGTDESQSRTEVPALTSLPRKIRSPYPALHNVGLNYGPTFAGIRDLSVKPGGKTAVATLQQAPLTGSEYSLHPTTIDLCLQLLGVASAQGLGRHLTKIPLPTSIHQLYVRPVDTSYEMQARAIAEPSKKVGDIKGQMLIVANHQILLSVQGCQLSAFEHESNVDIDERIAAARLSWRSDLDFAPLESLMISHVKDPNAIKVVETYGLLCTLEMQERLKGIDYCADHFTKFSHWIDNHVKEGRNAKNVLVSNSMEMLNLPREARLIRIEQLETELRSSEFNNVAELITRLLDNCVDVFKGDSQILDIYLRENGLTKLYAITGDRISSTEFFVTAGHTKPTMKILEIGAGTGGTTLVALQSLSSINGEPMYSKYTFTDISSGFFSAAKDRFVEYPGLEFKTLDISRDPQEQGFELGTYDLIVASNVIHATDFLNVTLTNVRKLMNPRGRFFLQELTPSYAKMINIIMGPLPGWWLGGADNREMEPIVSTERWDRELRAAGFSGIECAVRDDPRLEGHIGVNIIAKLAQDVQEYRTVTLLILPSQVESTTVQVIEQLLVEQGYHLNKCNFGEQLPPFQDIISLVELDSTLFNGVSQEDFGHFQRIIAGLNSARLLWVMGSAQVEPQNPRSALTLGLTRSIRTELNIPIATLEVDKVDSKASEAIVDVFEKFKSTAADVNPDYEYVLYDHHVLVGRYHWAGISKELARSHDTSEHPLRLEGGRNGASKWVPVPHGELGPGEVQVTPAFIGVDAKTAASHSGSGPLLGGSGTVTAVGSDVQNIRTGDRVVMLDRNLLATSAVLQSHQLAVVPSTISLEDAASLPVAFPMAIYTLLSAANLQKGQSILITSISDDVGLAAMQLARMVGAEAYCTVLDDTEAEFVRSKFDVPEFHILRSASFSPAVLKGTDDRGVDVVLNRLSGERAGESWKSLARRGMMIDLTNHGASARSSPDIDLFTAGKTRIRADVEYLDDLYSELLQKVVELYGEGKIELVGAPHVIDAHAHAKSDGSPMPAYPSRLLVRIPPRAECLPVTQSTPLLQLRNDAAYLLVGGLGGLGQAIATYMIERGARHFLFLSRSAGTSEEHVEFFRELESQGCTATAIAGDVSKLEDVETLVCQSPRPIAGVLQLAMVLQDRPFLKMSHDDWLTSIRPKVDGTWNLHEALRDQQLDFFVIFGSISGTFGIAHQANYAASNTFQDAFVQYRHSLGLPASVLNIGAMADIGYVSENQSVQDYFRSAGMPFMSESELLEAMHLSMLQQLPSAEQQHPVSSTSDVKLGFTSTSQLALGIRATKPMDDPGNRVLWKRDRRVDIYRNIEASRVQSSTGNATSDEDKLDAFINELRSTPSLLTEPGTLSFLTHEIGVSIYNFMLQPVEDLDTSKALMTLGVDSLVTIEIRNWLRRRLDVEVSTLEILNGGTIESLGQLAMERLRKKYGGEGRSASEVASAANGTSGA